MKVPFAIRALLARLMDLPEESIDAVESDCGSGFGVRGEFYPEDFLIPFAARRLNRPVKWIEDRREHLLATTHAREVECELEIACRKDGVILALRGKAWCDVGAYIRPNAVTAPRNLAQMISGPYRVPHVHMDVAMMLSNKTPSGSYRGPGRFEADFFRERMIDLAAQDLGIDRVEFRRRNLVSEAEIPYALAKILPYGTAANSTAATTASRSTAVLPKSAGPKNQRCRASSWTGAITGWASAATSKAAQAVLRRTRGSCSSPMDRLRFTSDRRRSARVSKPFSRRSRRTRSTCRSSVFGRLPRLERPRARRLRLLRVARNRHGRLGATRCGCKPEGRDPQCGSRSLRLFARGRPD